MTAPLNLDSLEKLFVSPVEFHELWLGGGDGERDVVLDDPEFERLMQVYRAVPALIQEVRRLQRQNEELVGDYETAAVVLKGMVRHCGLEIGPSCVEWDTPIGSLGLVLAENYLRLRDKP